MKKRLAILLLSALVLTCAITALSASAATYTDKVDLLPASESDIKINGGVPLYELKDGKLSLTRDGEDNIAWPSIVYDVNQEVDLSETPYLHMSFETSGAGDRGVNGFIYYSIGDGEEVSAQLSDAGGNGIDDFRDTADMYIDLAKYLGTNEKIYIHRIALSVYGGMGETIVWNALALASAGEGTDEPSDEPSEEEPSDEPSAEEPSEAESSEETSSVEASSEAPAESSTPAESSSATSANTSTDTSSEAPAEPDGISTLGIVLIVVGCVAVVAVVVIIIVKKKK